MPFREAAQLGFGLALPFLLIPHVTGTRIELALTGREAGYPEVIGGSGSPPGEWRPPGGSPARRLAPWLPRDLLLASVEDGFPRLALLLYTGALLVPLLALLGFAAAGKIIAADPQRFAEPALPAPRSCKIRTGLYVAFAALIGAALAARALRISRNWSKRLRVSYPGERVVTVPRGFTVLEASRAAGIPHASCAAGAADAQPAGSVWSRGWTGSRRLRRRSAPPWPARKLVRM